MSFCVLNCFQNAMPLSAGLFKSERKNTVAQCPPRLHVQYLTSAIWSRVPTCFPKVEVSVWLMELIYSIVQIHEELLPFPLTTWL